MWLDYLKIAKSEPGPPGIARGPVDSRSERILGAVVLHGAEQMDGVSHGAASLGGGVEACPRIGLVANLLDAATVTNGVLKQ